MLRLEIESLEGLIEQEEEDHAVFLSTYATPNSLAVSNTQTPTTQESNVPEFWAEFGIGDLEEPMMRRHRFQTAFTISKGHWIGTLLSSECRCSSLLHQHVYAVHWARLALRVSKNQILALELLSKHVTSRDYGSWL